MLNWNITKSAVSTRSLYTLIKSVESRFVQYEWNGIMERYWNTCFEIQLVQVEWHRWESWRQKYIDVMNESGSLGCAG